jgi:hypothetical protein
VINLARLLLKDSNPAKYVVTRKTGRLKRGESAELSADNIVSFLGTEHWEVTLSEEEVNGLSDKKLALAQRLLRLKSKEAVLKALLPEKTIVKTVTSAVKSVTPSLNKKVTKEETSDEAILADDSE